MAVDAERAASLADIARLNAWSAGHRLTSRGVAPPAGAPRRVPRRRATSGGGRRRFRAAVSCGPPAPGRAVRVVVLDRDPDALAFAGDVAGLPGDRDVLVRGDAAALPFREGAVDVAASRRSSLHHLDRTRRSPACARWRAAARARRWS